MAGIIRAPRPAKDYTEIANATARDFRLSYRARGVLLRLLSNADGFRMTAIDLANDGQEGREAVLTALKELRLFGYLVVRRYQSERGQWKTETYVYDTPQSTEVGFPDSGLPDPGSPDAGWPDPIQKDQQKNQQTAAAPRASAEPTARKNAAAAPVEISTPAAHPAPTTPASGGKRRRLRTSGILTWSADDEIEAEHLEGKHTADDISAAVAAIKAKGKDPVPGRVSLEIERITARKQEKARRERDLALSQQAPATIPPTEATKSHRLMAEYEELPGAERDALLEEFSSWLYASPRKDIVIPVFRKSGLSRGLVKSEFELFLATVFGATANRISPPQDIQAAARHSACHQPGA